MLRDGFGARGGKYCSEVDKDSLWVSWWVWLEQGVRWWVYYSQTFKLKYSW